MCGIMGMAGLPRGFSAVETTATLRAMGSLLRHRGPDGWGEYIGGGIALGHTRLSILDLELGKQPMVSADGAAVLVFNGEIYNFKDLWRELESKGHHFRTDHSDTEVILNGYLEWGAGIFRRLDGMFAAAIWDGARNTLLLARDRAGIKPLYYAMLPAGIVFASEPKAIVRCGLVS